MLILEILIVLGVIALDLVSKSLVSGALSEGETIPVLEDIFHITYHKNTGAAWSILEGELTFFIVLTSISVVVICVVMFLNRKGPMMLRLPLSLILGGAIGNFVDRIAFGYVRDMFDFRIINFPVFNVADMALTIGVAILAVYIIFIYKEPEKGAKEATVSKEKND